MNKLLYPALRIALVYLIFSALWIFFSDSIVAYISPNTDTLNFLQTIKGWTFVAVTAILLYIMINKQMQKETQLHNALIEQKKELEMILQSAPNPTIVYNEDGDILLMNKAWLQITGYQFEEINTIDKWVHKAYQEKAINVKSIIDTLYAIDKRIDNGIFEIYTHSNDVVIWHFNSAPLGIRNGKRTIISSAIDITELEAKNQLIVQQSKLAAMGEMIENIAHQWRQPLSSISSLATGIQLKKETNDLTDEYFEDSLQTINYNAQYLSHTIDDFRSFFEQESVKHDFDLKSTFLKALKLLKYKLKDTDITVIQKFEDVNINSYENELIQVILNLFNNALDAFDIHGIQKRVLIAEIIKESTTVKIELTDSAGGIDEKIIDKIFEPYFTTKHKSQGTGIGLYMCEEIVTKHMKGTIEVKNTKFMHENQSLKGAKFTITLPL